MPEYIERDKVLSKEEFFGEHDTWDNPMADGCMAVRSDFIMNLPAADVVEVVRCKECKHYVPAEDDGEMMCVKDADWCVEDGCYYGFTDSHDADWFCADGEMRADNG